MKKTTLFEQHSDLGAKIVDFVGYQMPLSYEGVSAEHHQVRNDCGVFDVSHMGEFFVSGDQATADVVGHLVGTAAIEPTEPVHPEQVAGVGLVAVEAGQRGDAGCGDCRGVGQLGKGRGRDVALLEPLHGAFVDALIRDLGGEAQRLVGPCDFSSVDHSL